MDIISLLPVDVPARRILSFLGLKGLVQLDSAVVSKTHRRLLLEEIYPRCQPQTLPRGGKLWRPACLWFILRGTRVSCFTASAETEDMFEALSLNKHLVDEIELIGTGQDEYHRIHYMLTLHALASKVTGLSFKAQQADLCWAPAQDEALLWSKLRSVTFSVEGGVQNAWITARLQHAHNLQSILLCDVLDLDVAPIPMLARTLVDIELRRCRVSNAIVESIGRTCHMLQTIALHETTLPDSVDPLQASGLITLARGCPLLKSVTFPTACPEEAVIETFATHCKGLQNLSTPLCTLGTTAMAALTQHCPDLTGLSALCEVETLSPNAPTSVLLRRLSRLELTVHIQSSGEAAMTLEVIAECCTVLQELRVHFQEVAGKRMACRVALARALAAVAQANPHVTSIAVHGLAWHALPDADLLTVAQCWPQLQVLNITGRLLSNAAVAAFAAHCPALTLVLLNGPPNKLADHGIVALAAHCPALHVVDLTGAYNITEAAVIQLALHCPQLLQLTVSINLTQKATDCIAQFGQSSAVRPHPLVVSRSE